MSACTYTDQHPTVGSWNAVVNSAGKGKACFQTQMSPAQSHWPTNHVSLMPKELVFRNKLFLSRPSLLAQHWPDPLVCPRSLVPSSSQAAQLQCCFQPFYLPQYSRAALPALQGRPRGPAACGTALSITAPPRPLVKPRWHLSLLESCSAWPSPWDPPPHASIPSALLSSSLRAVSPSPLCLPHSQVLQRLCSLSPSSFLLRVTHAKQRWEQHMEPADTHVAEVSPCKEGGQLI